MTFEKLTDIKELRKIKENYNKDFPKNERIPFYYLKRLFKKQM